MNPKIISIIGGCGQMGKKFAREFRRRGYRVLISDISTRLSNKDVAKQGDIVIVTVPIHKTISVIEEIIPSLKKNALLTDFTSVKKNPLKVMSRVSKKNEVIGGHPLFGSTTDFGGQNFILCEVQTGKYSKWYEKFLEDLGLNILKMTADEHDKQMAVIQCLTHFSTLSLGYTLQSMNYNLARGEKIATPVYLMRLYAVGRILAQDASLYTDMQIFNPYAKKVILNYKKSVNQLSDIIKKDDDIKFQKVFNKSKKYFGVVAKRAMKVTDKLIKALS